jgi:predicted Ser/Thr protein kinase
MVSSDPPDPSSTRRHADDAQPTLIRKPADEEEIAASTAVRASTAVHATAAPAIAATAVRAATEPQAPFTGAAASIGPGATIRGRFDIEALIGRGGMGSVYSAVDLLKVEARDPNPRVAVKVLNADFREHPDAFVALQREASKAQALAHPNIVTVFDFDRDGGTAFITMELLRGRSLETMTRQARGTGLDRKTALPIIRGIAEGLAYAHRKGVVHSDLKPANVFLLDDGTPKILDFGIARAVPGASGGATRDEFDAGRLGAYTEAYATGEMIRGVDPAPADDLYALGIIACELLTGSHPYGGRSVPQARQAAVKPAIPTALRRSERKLIARCLDFDRSCRPRDAAEFLRLLTGVAPWLKVLAAAVIALTLASGYLWYRNYQASGPAVPFEQLERATQQQVRVDLAQGEEAWKFYRSQGIGDGLNSALDYYSRAYALHKGNRDAVSGLRRTADEFLKLAHGDRQQLREKAAQLAGASEYLKSYPPVVDALQP